MSLDKKIAELIIQQTIMISGLANIVADLITMNVASLELCEKCKKDPVTVEHKHVLTRMCDKCAAESIVLSGKNYAKGFMENPDDPLNTVRSSLMLDENWVDIKNAELVRRLVEYAKIVQKDIDTSDVN